LQSSIIGKGLIYQVGQFWRGKVHKPGTTFWDIPGCRRRRPRRPNRSLNLFTRILDGLTTREQGATGGNKYEWKTIHYVNSDEMVSEISWLNELVEDLF
ncbi:MAG: hypothetical protein ABGZ08_07300, partial [Akkermansiaceae bacterium]